eukprot:SAG31_NODE_7393_length_1701_cov_1.629213_1_plen_402_part_00
MLTSEHAKSSGQPLAKVLAHNECGYTAQKPLAASASCDVGTAPLTAGTVAPCSRCALRLGTAVPHGGQHQCFRCEAWAKCWGSANNKAASAEQKARETAPLTAGTDAPCSWCAPVSLGTAIPHGGQHQCFRCEAWTKCWGATNFAKWATFTINHYEAVLSELKREFEAHSSALELFDLPGPEDLKQQLPFFFKEISAQPPAAQQLVPRRAKASSKHLPDGNLRRDSQSKSEGATSTGSTNARHKRSAGMSPEVPATSPRSPMASGSPVTLTVKVYVANTEEYFRFDLRSPSFELLHCKLTSIAQKALKKQEIAQKAFLDGHDLKITYLDDENDPIRLLTQEGLETFIRLLLNSSALLRLTLTIVNIANSEPAALSDSFNSMLMIADTEPNTRLQQKPAAKE